MKSPAIRLHEVVFDCHNLEAVAGFWSRLLGYRLTRAAEDLYIVDCGALRLSFQPAPQDANLDENLTSRNRMRLDLEVADLDESKAFAESLGALTLSETTDTQNGIGEVVMQDVENNEFCLMVDEQQQYFSKIKRALVTC